MTNAELLANKLYELRKVSGLSQEEFAEKLNVSRQAVSKWERGETLPDTDNLITIAKLYGISLDELISHNPTSTAKAQTETDSNSQTSTCEPEDEEDTVFYQQESSNDDNYKVKINEDGIFVDATDGDANVKIDLSPLGLKIVKGGQDVDLDEDDEDGEDEYYSYDEKPADKKRKILRFFYHIPYPIIVTIAFLLWGFLAPDGRGWAVGWTLYITVPVYYSIIDCIKSKRLSPFCYPVFVAFIYCFIGMQWGLWHPYWVLFITIPVFYGIVK